MFLWDNGKHRLLFPGDSIWVQGGEWKAVLLAESDRETYLASLSLLMDLDFDMLVPWGSEEGQPYGYGITHPQAHEKLKGVIERLRLEATGSRQGQPVTVRNVCALATLSRLSTALTATGAAIATPSPGTCPRRGACCESACGDLVGVAQSWACWGRCRAFCFFSTVVTNLVGPKEVPMFGLHHQSARAPAIFAALGEDFQDRGVQEVVVRGELPPGSARAITNGAWSLPTDGQTKRTVLDGDGVIQRLRLKTASPLCTPFRSDTQARRRRGCGPRPYTQLDDNRAGTVCDVGQHMRSQAGVTTYHVNGTLMASMRRIAGLSRSTPRHLKRSVPLLLACRRTTLRQGARKRDRGKRRSAVRFHTHRPQGYADRHRTPSPRRHTGGDTYGDFTEHRLFARFRGDRPARELQPASGSPSRAPLHGRTGELHRMP